MYAWLPLSGFFSFQLCMTCFLSHEVVEKSLKAVYLAKCGSTLANQHEVALYDQLSAARCWPLTDMKDSVLLVSDHNMRCRYPDHHVPPEAPCVLYTGLDAQLTCFSSCSKSVCRSIQYQMLQRQTTIPTHCIATAAINSIS